jgi:hypothetical protein
LPVELVVGISIHSHRRTVCQGSQRVWTTRS